MRQHADCQFQSQQSYHVTSDWAIFMILKQVHIENAADADYIFSMLMGDDVAPRREFIERNATYANIDA